VFLSAHRSLHSPVMTMVPVTIGMYVLTEKESSHEPPDLKKARKEDHSHLLSPVLLCFTANVPAKGFYLKGEEQSEN
jgi:hypothetical protein